VNEQRVISRGHRSIRRATDSGTVIDKIIKTHMNLLAFILAGFMPPKNEIELQWSLVVYFPASMDWMCQLDVSMIGEW
jgi:hypothetical protein